MAQKKQKKTRPRYVPRDDEGRPMIQCQSCHSFISVSESNQARLALKRLYEDWRGIKKPQTSSRAAMIVCLACVDGMRQKHSTWLQHHSPRSVGRSGRYRHR